MATLTIRMPDDKAERLKSLADHRDVSVNKLMEELATFAIAQYDTENRFRARQARGSARHGLALLNELDAYYASHPADAVASRYGMHDQKQRPFEPMTPPNPKPKKRPKK